ncbi:hypothetical protein MVI01_44650 [Myxococcus virescens]|uniref:Uncharacterized protein n=1 Tax=Myxococcus virescens TaxID=83456 RepID=A0A511HGK4_9BACT|nr:hypothetical protein MVI01_44650 [Myxococcus virescens]
MALPLVVSTNCWRVSGVTAQPQAPNRSPAVTHVERRERMTMFSACPCGEDEWSMTSEPGARLTEDIPENAPDVPSYRRAH